MVKGQAVDRVVAYIDGFNLYYGLKSKGWRRYYWLNPEALVRALLKPGQGLVETKYFTARVASPPTDPDKERRQNVFLEAIGTLRDTTIFYGHYLRKTQKCFQCGATWDANEEKMTDVNIAVEILMDAFEDRFDTALLISADSDLRAPVRRVRERFPPKRVVVACPPNRQSRTLELAAHAYFRIGRKKIQDSQFPDEVVKADGFTLMRPESWR